MDLRFEKNRRKYESTARLLLLMAMDDIARDAIIRFGHSLGVGIYVTVEGLVLSTTKLRRIEEKMHEIAAQNLPIRQETWPVERAIAFFEEKGQMDTVELLRFQNGDTVSLTICDGYIDLLSGPTTEHTGDIDSFSLRLFYPGMVLILKSMSQVISQGAFKDRPKLMRAYSEFEDWARIQNCRNAADLNNIILSGAYKDFIRVSESIQSRALTSIAEEIADLGCRVVFIAGPSSSGKTTFANRLAIELKVSGRHPIPISLDNYYKNQVDIPIGENGKPDLECLESIDTELFNEQLLELLQGERVEIPLYSFYTKNREPEGKLVSIGERDVLIVEGIHGLNPAIGADVPSESKYRIYVGALTPLNLDNHNRLRATDIRLLRRLVRDARTRNTRIRETLDMWDDVKIGEIKYISPYMEEANVVFNTTLSYEIPVLKKYVTQMLSEVPDDSPHYSSIQRIRQFLDYFVEITDESDIPPISILREFIGGCTFYDNDR